MLNILKHCSVSTHSRMPFFSQNIMIILALAGQSSLAGTATNEMNQPLVWESETIQITLAANQHSAEGWFVFTNESPNPVTILNVSADCDCVITQSALGVVYPDEAGVILATVSLKPDESMIEKVVTVDYQTADSGPTTVSLKLAAVRQE